jgi:hypothetical protein
MKTLLMMLLVMAVALLAAAPNASAQGYGGCNGAGWGYGYDMGYLYNSLDYNVPYFAAHPPVYYSYPVPRTYGYSPFAYPPNVMTPDVMIEDSQPVEIINPYVPSTQTSATSTDQSAAASPKNRQPEPLVIINPYVAGAGAIAKAAN